MKKLSTLTILTLIFGGSATVVETAHYFNVGEKLESAIQTTEYTAQDAAYDACVDTDEDRDCSDLAAQ